jgi:hypothetical protein
MNLTKKIKQFDEWIQDIYDAKGRMDNDLKILLSARQVLCELDTDKKISFTYNFESRESTFRSYYANHNPLVLIPNNEDCDEYLKQLEERALNHYYVTQELLEVDK